MDELRLPDRRPFPDRASVRAALQSEVQRRRGPRRLVPSIGKWSVGIAVAGLAATVGVLTIVGQGGDSERVTAPAVGQVLPYSDQVLHLVSETTRDGKLLVHSESWSTAGAVPRERLALSYGDAAAPPAVEWESVGDQVMWHFDGLTATVSGVLPGAGGENPLAANRGSAATWRATDTIRNWVEPFGQTETERIDGRPVSRYQGPSRQRGKIGLTLFRDATQLPAGVQVLRTHGTRRVVELTTWRAELLPATESNLDLLSIQRAHRGAVVATSASAAELSARAIRPDLVSRDGSDPAAIEASLVNGESIFVDTDPSCRAERVGMEYTCTLTRAPVGDRTGDAAGDRFSGRRVIADAKLRVSGVCTATSREGLTWRCLLGDEAVRAGWLPAGVLGMPADPPWYG